LWLLSGPAKEASQATVGGPAEDYRRTTLAVDLKNDITKYYEQYKQYPPKIVLTNRLKQRL